MAWKHLATLEPSFARMMGNTPDVGESNLINMLESDPNITMIWWPNMRSDIIIPYRLAIKQHSIQKRIGEKETGTVCLLLVLMNHVCFCVHHVWSSAIISIIIAIHSNLLSTIIPLWFFMISSTWFIDIYSRYSFVFPNLPQNSPFPLLPVAPWDHCDVRIACGHFCNELFCSLHAGLAWNTHGMSKWNDIFI